ncbi:MAG: dTDP-glucose 4,6-dehydratase [Myxococcales bacterium]|nr:dTDP-glucose 4,6-dehydratase [Myxococcales bacterium]
MRVLVTGGAGFIGSNLVRYLLAQPQLERLVNLDCLTYAGNLQNLAGVDGDARYVFEQVDLRDADRVLDTMRRHAITRVMHLAAESHVDRSIAAPGAFMHTNVIGTFNLLEAARACWPSGGGERLLHVSTDEVYGSLGREGLFSESTPYSPRSPYSASKAGADMLVRAYHHTYGLPVLVTNCSNNYGPYQHAEKLIPTVIGAAIREEPIPVYGDGMNVRDWLHVEDHCRALWTVLERGRVGETYNVGANNEWANLRLVERIADAVDEVMGRRPGRSRELINFVPDRAGHDRRYAIDASKLREELGWRPEHELEAGLRDTVRWYVERARATATG